MDLLLRDATVAIPFPPTIEKCDLRIRDGRILQRAKGLTRNEREETVDLSAKLVLPGLVCSHTHLYSSLSRGMPAPTKPPRNFPEILQNIWWKLDRALDNDAIYYSALTGCIEAIRCGTTTIVDHHSSPCAISGSLDLIKDALEQVAVRSVLCYEVTDRGGMKERDRGLQENERFAAKHRDHPRSRGVVGAHASFTLDTASLRACGELAKSLGTGVHLHVAEDLYDVNRAERKYNCSVVKRLEECGILGRKSILAHCVHVGRRDFERIRKSGSWVVHNPRSNMNNAVGHAPLPLFPTCSALGTDGFPADMFEECRIGYFRNREATDSVPGERLPQFLHNGQRMVSEIFGEEFGTLRPGSVADLIILDYVSPTPLSRENLLFHVLFGMRSSHVQSVMVGGKWVLWNREFVEVNEEEIMNRAGRVAQKLWKRINDS